MAQELFKNSLEGEHHSNMTKLNENGRIHVFCFPPVLGYGMVYKEMARQLEGHCIVYGIDFIEDQDRRGDELNDYVDAIISVQEHGPFVLAGYSLGGNLAFEVAKIMEKRGYEVSDLLIIDALKMDGTMQQIEDISGYIDSVLEKSSDSYKLVLTESRLREKVRNKMYAYLMYRNQLINTGNIQASIHSLTAGPKEDDLLWKQSTLKNYAQYPLIGDHSELLEPGFIEENAKSSSKS
ncbi:thioesterase domain-containing protein [Paenibacillus tyrfis]|uniref:thioesterase domain-containing protein n=1 Tax=Paenibacillus tyrfis TaxID=1501230 RepID=UPI0035B54B01